MEEIKLPSSIVGEQEKKSQRVELFTVLVIHKFVQLNDAFNTRILERVIGIFNGEEKIRVWREKKDFI